MMKAKLSKSTGTSNARVNANQFHPCFSCWMATKKRIQGVSEQNKKLFEILRKEYANKIEQKSALRGYSKWNLNFPGI